MTAHTYDVPTHLKTVEMLKAAIAAKRPWIHVHHLNEAARFAFPALDNFHSYITRKDEGGIYMLVTVNIGTEIHKMRVYQESALEEATKACMIGPRPGPDLVDEVTSYLTGKSDDMPVIVKATGSAAPERTIDDPADPETKVTGTVDITPRGLMTPEGIQRVNDATEAMHDGKAALCNWLLQLTKETGAMGSRGRAKALCDVLNRKHYRADPEELAELIERAELSEENFIRALANRPARVPAHQPT